METAPGGGGLMRWPWQRREKRESSFTDALVTQILASAAGASLAQPTAIVALECAANLYARGFAAARVQGPAWAQRALSPACLALCGRVLIRSGELVLAIDATDGELRLWPAADYDVHGSFDSGDWTYRLNLAGPSVFTTRDPVPASGVVHLMYARDPQRPWRGVGPLDAASSTGALAANLKTRLSEEAGGPVGHLLPIPQDGGGDDDPLMSFKADIRAAKGRPLLVETTAAGFGEGPGLGAGARLDRPALRRKSHANPADPARRRGHVGPRRLRRNPGVGGVGGRNRSSRRLATIHHGVSRAAVADRGPGALRQAGNGRELRPTGLWAHDLQGRAAAFQKLVAGGVSVNEALTTSGLLGGEET